MAAPTVRTLDQIMAEIDPVYSKQVNSIKQRQASLPGQIKAEEQGLEAKQTQAFDNILGGARRRGLGFSGIPLGEQAEYTASEYLPALARLRQTGREQALSLEDAILGIQERRQNQALGMRQYEQQRYDQFQEAERARRAAAAASAGNNSWMSALGAGSGGLTEGAPSQVKIPKGLQALYNQVFLRSDGSEWDDRSLVSDYNATLKSARYGNTRDKQKLELYHSARPDLFGGSIPVAALGNGGGLSF